MTSRLRDLNPRPPLYENLIPIVRQRPPMFFFPCFIGFPALYFPPPSTVVPTIPPHSGYDCGYCLFHVHRSLFKFVSGAAVQKNGEPFELQNCIVVSFAVEANDKLPCARHPVNVVSDAIALVGVFLQGLPH
jgi:hypothetical protein